MASNHSSKAAARGCRSSLPAVLRKCYETIPLWLILFALVRCLPQLKVALGCAPGYFAEYLGILSILELTPPGEAHPLSQRPFL